MDAADELQAAMEATFDAIEARPQPVRLQDRDEQYWLLIGRVDQENSAR